LAYQAIWHNTELPSKVVDCVIEDLEKYKLDQNLHHSKIDGDVTDSDIRNSKNCWLPTSHWIGGFIWHYIQLANRDNFLFDIKHIEADNIQYTSYGVGEHYTWHIDAGMSGLSIPTSKGAPVLCNELATDFINKNCELTRKLSFSLQLSDEDSYEGGQLQFIDENKRTFFAPKKKGTMCVFDSRMMHRVRPVTSGVRKSLVGWVSGPRWR
jgi:hypothetical protein